MGFLYPKADVRPSVPQAHEQWKTETDVRLPTWLRLGVKNAGNGILGFTEDSEALKKND